MLNYAETASISTNVSPSEGAISSPSPIDADKYVPLYISGQCYGDVSIPLKDGYLAACRAYKQMEEQDENGPYTFLSGYEYAHLARQYIPTGLSRLDKREWHCGFVLGWSACIFGLADYMLKANEAHATR